ncbi:MAG: threonine--tRNA ligase [Clostridia bacterium]|nr:threonine--tRNA ligase [Clostridia bacterium]
MIITLKDGSQLKYSEPKALYEIANDISEGLMRASLSAEVDGIVTEMQTVIDHDCTVNFLTFDDQKGRDTLRHTASHILAQAVKRLYPDAKLAIGPSIENGFYYDFDCETSFSTDVLKTIEGEMKKIVKENLPVKRFTMQRDEAIKFFEDKGEIYKVELIKDLPENEEISLYQQGDFVDLCAGPHVSSTGKVKAFCLTGTAGAYWRGSEKNKMLQRIYGTAFLKKTDMEEHLLALEEARKRDHNKLGRELDIFTTVDVIGQGLPVMLPKGTKILQTLQRWVEDVEEENGWMRTKTPLMAKSDLYKISGHWDHYLDGMFVMGDEAKDKEVFALRPMTCPFQYQAYLSKMRSYRDLPLRYAETSTLFRNESSGEMHGLIRVRQFTISEGHLMCRPDQLEDEFRGCLEITNYMLKTLGLYDDVSYRFSQWDPDDREKYIGTDEQWAEAQGTMKKILDDLGIDYKIGIGEAAFYGPKLDIQIKNVFGKEDTLVTIQVDQMLAEKFGMEYTDTDGSKKNPYIIHRTSIGCYERTLALLIEKYAGAFPTWLAPVQVKLLPITDGQKEYAREYAKVLKANGISVEVDDRNEKIGYKIREAQLEKVPYMLIIGEKEKETETVSVRSRRDGDLGQLNKKEFVEKITLEIKDKVR